MGKDDKPIAWETILGTIRKNIEYARKTFYDNYDVAEIKLFVPIGIIRGEKIDRVGWLQEEQLKTYLCPKAIIIFRNKVNGQTSITSNSLELQVGTLITENFKRNKNFKYYIRNKRVVVSYQIISENHLERQINNYIKECNNIKLLYCI